ncbi:MAG TPA: hypothetical protein VFR37_13960, partial [Longimicrobium sp.]|nr:hypothetical protein [Longimicrobium sp.]
RSPVLPPPPGSSSHPARATRGREWLVFAVAAAVLLACAVAVGRIPEDVFVPSRGAFAPPVLGGILLLGAGGMWLALRTGLVRDDASVGFARRWMVPALAGAAFGVMTENRMQLGWDQIREQAERISLAELTTDRASVLQTKAERDLLNCCKVPLPPQLLQVTPE